MSAKQMKILTVAVIFILAAMPYKINWIKADVSVATALEDALN